jgi:beta-glucosidase/6-phospho-beta-glucosidase/beta-galactosidase
LNRKGMGFRSLARAYYDRYRLPLFHCETNAVSHHAVDWLERQWDDVTHLISTGVPVRGFTWYSLTDQIDWQHALRHEYNDLHPVGLFDLQRRIRPVGEAYRRVIADHQHLVTGAPPSRPMEIVA